MKFWEWARKLLSRKLKRPTERRLSNTTQKLTAPPKDNRNLDNLLRPMIHWHPRNTLARKSLQSPAVSSTTSMSWSTVWSNSPWRSLLNKNRRLSLWTIMETYTQSQHTWRISTGVKKWATWSSIRKTESCWNSREKRTSKQTGARKSLRSWTTELKWRRNRSWKTALRAGWLTDLNHFIFIINVINNGIKWVSNANWVAHLRPGNS